MKVWLPTVRTGSGADVFVQRLAAGLDKAGHEPVIEWFDHHFELMPWRLRNRAAPPGTDVIHAGSWQGFAFKRAGIPLVVTEHHYVWHPKFLPYRGLRRMAYHNLLVRPSLALSYRRADALVAVSETTAGAMRSDFEMDVQVIPNWIDTDRFSPAGGIAAPREDRRFRVLYVGNPSPRKGSDLLPTLSEMLGSGFEVVCLGGLRGGLAQEGAPANMTVLSSVNPMSMPDIYHSVDVVLVLARYEAFGYIALEAMACGVPVVGFDSTGTAEVCAQGATALLSPVDDLEQLTRDIRRLASDPELRERLAAAGRARALACYREEMGIQRYVDVYRNCLDRNSSGSRPALFE